MAIDEKRDHLTRRYCTRCRDYHDPATFGVDNRAPDRLASACRESRRLDQIKRRIEARKGKR